MVGRQENSGPGPVEAKLVQHLRHRGRMAARTDMSSTVRQCLAEAADIIDPRTSAAGPPATATGAAALWAREGVALEAVFAACYDGARAAVDHVEANAARGAGNSAEELLDGIRLLVRVLETVTTAASAAYLDEHQTVAKQHQTAAQTMVSALLSGHGVASCARRTGLRVASSYQVVALSIPPHPEEWRGGMGAASVGRRTLRRVQSALAAPLGSTALSLLNPDGGTVLVPLDGEPTVSPSPAINAEVLDILAEAAGVSLTAVVATGPAEQVPELTGRTNDALELLRATGRCAGLYRVTGSHQVPTREALATPRLGRSA